MADKKYLDNTGLQEVKDQMDLIYAPLDHNHDGKYADKEHTHDFNDLENKPNIENDETDDTLLVTDQNGNIVAKIDKDGVDSVDIKINGKSVAAGDHNHDETYAAKEHSHNEYAASNHNHDETYAAKEHNHDEDYAAKEHNHDEDYAAKEHNHDEDYAAKEHNHDETYAAKEHNHDDTYYTKDEVDEKVANNSGGSNGSSVDLSDYYSKAEVNEIAEGKADKEHTHDFNDLENKPNIENDEDNSLTITDQNGNIIAKIDANGVNTVDLLINGKPITKIFVGTQEEYDAANANGEIAEGTVIIITDDTEESGGSSSSGGSSGSSGGVIPTVETIENPTDTSPTFVIYDGQLYVLVEEEE